MLRRTTEFRQRQFFSRELLPRKRLHEGQTPAAVPLYSNPRNFGVPKKFSRSWPPEGEDTKQFRSRPPKRDTVSVIRPNCTNALHVRSKINKKRCPQYSAQHPTLTALQWVQQYLPVQPSMSNTFLSGRLHLAVTNWEKVIADSWVINTIQGYKIEFWALPRQLNLLAPLFLPEKEFNS